MNIPSHLQYTADHEWVLIEGEIATIGITEFAAEALGDIVYVELPAIGSQVSAGEACGEIESTKSVSDLNVPVDGEVTETNDAVAADPSLLNSSPYEAGWLLRVHVTNTGELLDAGAYTALISEGA